MAGRNSVGARKRRRSQHNNRSFIRKGDTVKVVAGDDRGKVGKVLQVIPQRNLVIVERVNFVKRHTRPRKQGEQGGILEMEAPLNLSNVLLYDPKVDRGVRVSVERRADGTFERISKASGDPIGSS
jgi:large subunit ribosomal protein L24